MIGAIIGAGLSAASSIFGAMKNRKAMNAYRQNLKNREAANEAWYERRYNEDPLARSSAQRMMTQVAERMKRSNRAAEGARAVMGGTEESVAATRAANAQAMADTASQIAANADARRDAMEAQYMARKDALAEQNGQMKLHQAQNIAAAVQGAGQAAGAIATSLDSVPHAQPDANEIDAEALAQIDTSLQKPTFNIRTPNQPWDTTTS